MKSYVSNVGRAIIINLRSCSDHIFHQKGGEVFETVFSHIRTPMPRGLLDKSGIDYCVFAEGADGLQTVFQCKGFEVRELTSDQVRQCLKSVESFKTSGFRVKEYFLVVNRIVKGDTRKKLEYAVEVLVQEGMAER